MQSRTRGSGADEGVCPTLLAELEREIMPLGLSVTEGAKVLGVSRQALNNIVNCKAGISAEMAIRLTKAFGSTAETWLRMQAAYDLAQAMKNESKIKVRRQRVPAELRA